MVSYKITDKTTKMLKQVNDLVADKAAYLSTLSTECKEFIHKNARISNIGSSTRIENAVLTDSQIEWMDEMLSVDGRPTAFRKEKGYIENKLSKDRERSIEEVAGCRNMLSIIYSQAGDLFPLSETTIKGLHNELLQFYPPASHYLGRYKIAPNSVVERVVGTDISRDVLKTADPGPITEVAMRDLMKWYNEMLRTHPWPIAVAAEFVFRFLAIHPFQDGNGRIGRGLFILSLLQSEDKKLVEVASYIAIDRHIERHKEEYYLVLRRCSEGKFLQDPREYKIEFFLNFILKMMGRSVSGDIDFYAARYNSYIKLAAAPKTVLACFKDHPEKKLALKDIVGYTKLPKRTSIHALNALVREGFLQKSGKGPSTKYQLKF